MNTHRWIQITVVVAILTLVVAGRGVSNATPSVSDQAVEFAGEPAEAGQPEVQPGDVPEGLTADDWASMQELMREAQYQFTWQVSDGEWAYCAPNRAHDLSLSLGADGFHTDRSDAEGELMWDLSLSLVAYGEQTFPTAIAEGDLIGSRERVEYHWSQDVVEWYANSAEGVQHGLTLAAPPAGTDGTAVELAFALHGSLTPELDNSGSGLRLKDSRDETALLYDQLAATDATGRSLPTQMRLIGCVHSATCNLQLVIDDAGATYPLRVTLLLHDQLTKLTASDAEDHDQFGWSVGISGDTVVVGARYEDGTGSSQGAAYVFTRNQDGADGWGEVTKLTASDAADSDYFGYAVAISGDIVVVGADGEDGAGGPDSNRGAAYVFERNQGGADNWGEVTKLTASDTANYDYFGISVGISGDTVVVGAYGEDGAGSNRGAAYVFERNQGGADNWGEVAKLVASDAADLDYFGISVGISGDTVVVGAAWEDGVGGDRGAAYVFERNQGGADNWGQVSKLTASDTADDDYFGRSVTISGDTVVVGAYGEDGAGSNRGAAYVFERNQGGTDIWGEVKKLTASDAADDDAFGQSVAISGDTVVVGAHAEDGEGSSRGAAYVYERNYNPITPATPIANNWGEVEKLTTSDGADDDYFGYAVAISGGTLVAGAYGEDGIGSERGAAYLFVVEGGQWQEVANPRASDAEEDGRFGGSVAVSGDTAVVGAFSEDGAGEDRGAAYVFERNQGGADGWGQVQKLTASDAEDGDIFGVSVFISGDTIVVGASREDGTGGAYDNRGAAYVFERNQGGADNWGQVRKLTASDTEDGDGFGSSVAISGDTVVVGAYSEDGAGSNRGAAYVFERNYDPLTPATPLANNWGQVRKLTASDAADDDYFGGSVAISGDTVAVGASGEEGAYVFERNQGGMDIWGQVQKLTASDAENGDQFGASVAISGDTVVVGAFTEDGPGTDYSNRGAAYVFERNQGGMDNWGQVQKLTASDAQDSDLFGVSVAISGDTVVVGAHEEDGAGGPYSQRGAAYVFERNQGGADSWGQVQKLTASDAENGDNFGGSVAISGDTVVVGAYIADGAGSAQGESYVFVLRPFQIYLPLVLQNY